mmetsp:Transcript_8091/g.23206  ORF Transcript_8091/g.23206 Transcript_8091/m.23206 type:complete len:245 (-) Transcript_8091:178-912(-)
MDHSEEQSMELEALEAIWPTEFKPLAPDDPSPAGWPMEPTVYTVDITAAAEGEDPEEYGERMELVFQHTPTYPEEPPRLKLRSVKGLSAADLADIQSKVEAQVEENMGMAMIYTLAEYAKEWLRDRSNIEVVEEIDPEEAKARALEEEQKRIAEQRALGTPVTPENFKVWREKFDAERALARAMDPNLISAKEKENRLTGKQYFVQTDASKISKDQEELQLDDEDFDFDDDDDEGMLDEYLGAS